MDVDAVETRTFGISASEIATIDRWIEAVGARWGIDNCILFSARLCTAELAANVLEHGEVRYDNDQMTVTLRQLCDGLEIEFVDSRGAFDPTCRGTSEQRGSRDAARLGAFGLKLLHAYAEELSYRNDGVCNRVKLKIRGPEPRNSESRGFTAR
jgi:anti-sigma regulatory factor (Ser/Thr protein kinase)